MKKKNVRERERERDITSWVVKESVVGGVWTQWPMWFK